MEAISVVVVDDSVTVLLFMEEILKQISKAIPLHFKMFSSAKAALLYVDKFPSDVLITDVEMSEMSGIELVSKVKELKPNVRCVVVSSLTTPIDFTNAKVAGADSYLIKPVDVSHLRSILRLTSLRKNMTT